MDRGPERRDGEQPEGGKNRSRSRGDGPSTADSSELRDPSAEAQDSMVQRQFVRLEKRIESQWQDTTTAMRTTVLELDAIQKERIQRIESRQDATEARLGAHDESLAQQADRLAKLEAELLLVRAPPPPARRHRG